MKKISKTFVLLVLYFLCNTIKGHAQFTNIIEFRYTVKYDDTFNFTDLAKAGVTGNGNGSKIRIAVFSEFNYAKTDDSSKKSFLFGFDNPNTSSTSQNISWGNVVRNSEVWDPYTQDNNALFTSSTPSNDLTYFKSQFTAHGKYETQFGWNSIGDETFDIVVRVLCTSPSLTTVRAIKIPGIASFNPNDVIVGNIKVYRGNNVLAQTIPIDSRIGSDYRLTTFQGDKVVFEANNGGTAVEGLTDTNVMRWAGECIFMQNTIGNQGEIKPFLFFDSNVHGVKMRKYPKDWRINNKNRYPNFIQSTTKPSKTLIWIANGRYDFPEIAFETPYNLNNFLQAYKTKGDGSHFPNTNKFFGGPQPGSGLLQQRNNQKEGLNMELLKAFKDKDILVAGLDPDEIIYKNFNQSDIVGNPAAAGKVFDYVSRDNWKDIDDTESGGINNSLRKFLTNTGKFMSGNEDYVYDGFEICDRNLYIKKEGSTSIEGKNFDYTAKQPMFNGKVPVYYNPQVTNEPNIHTKTLKFSIDERVFNIQLAVLSPLEGERKAKPYTALTAADRTNPDVNFYGIISGPIHVARYQKSVAYSVTKLPDDVPGLFRLVYTYEDSFGILNEYAARVTKADPNVTFNFQGGGYHDITLRYTSNPTDTDFSEEVIIAGKELMDIDLRFIFSPNDKDAADYSFNPSATYGIRKATDEIAGNIVLNENKANGKQWFLDNNNNKLINDNYGLNHGYKDHNVVRTYTMDRDETLTLSVIDADPHTFVHYNNDFYLSERRLSKRVTDAALETDIQWYVSTDPNFPGGGTQVSTVSNGGRNFKVSPKAIYPGDYRGDFYLKAVYKGTSEIKVKIAQTELSGNINNVITNRDLDLGTVKTYPLSEDQFTLLQKIAPSFYTKTINKYKIFKIQDILSSYTYAERENLAKATAPRYIAAGMAKEVGEHERFSEMNNYRSIFSWAFIKRALTEEYIDGLFFNFSTADAYGDYVTNYQSKWFPLNWVRHLDSTPQSPEIPLDGSSNVREFNTSQTSTLASYNGGVSPYEPWQVRLPWIAQSGLQGYKTRWNIKCIYDVNLIFNKNQVGNAYGVEDDANAYLMKTNGLFGNNIVKGAAGNSFDSLQREYQEFFWMLKNKEIVVVDIEKLNNTPGTNLVFIEVFDSKNNVFSKTIAKPAVTPLARMAQGKNEASLSTEENKISLCKVYPNPSSQGIFKLDINIPQENTNLELQLTDIAGKIIYRSLPQTVSGSYSTTVGEKLNLLKGVYLLTIKINDDTETQKLIVE